MINCKDDKQLSKESKMRVADGRIYFSRETERRCFFVLTLLMMAAGILFKLGVF